MFIPYDSNTIDPLSNRLANEPIQSSSPYHVRTTYFETSSYALKQECTKNKAYYTLFVSIPPLWMILTLHVVFILLSCHKNLRATKIYDECTKLTAQFTYYVEIRTGDTTSSFNRRKTTLTFDLFDDNQTTLARIAVPSHVIFGRRDMPIGVIDDDKYSELRVTRLWLYRATRLKRATTIRITHSCIETDARIMIYGIEIRSNDRDRNKLFFPIMSYISAYGATNKPNACFDIEPSGTISIMGGPQSESSTLSMTLGWVDYTTLGHLLLALIFYITSSEVVPDAYKNPPASIYNGAAVGAISLGIVVIFALLLRYVIKFYYDLSIGIGLSAWIYYCFLAAVVIFSTLIWLLAAVDVYKRLCSEEYSYWIMSLVISVIVSVTFISFLSLIQWLIQSVCPRSTEQYILPEELSNSTEQQSKSKPSYRQPFSIKHPHLLPVPIQHPQQSWHGMPPGIHVPLMSPPYSQSPQYPNMYSPGANNTMMNTMLSYKTLQTNYDPQPMMSLHPPTVQHQMQLSPQQQAQQQQQQQQPRQQDQTYNQQTTTNGGKTTKKIGSSESTGSTYYQQLMKNKGGVKSISQYGELMRQKKQATKANTGKQ